MNLTILIPTKNRYSILLLTLEYLIESGFNGNIIIADSSEDQIKLNEKFPNRNINQINCIGMNIQESMYYCVKSVKTKYVAYSGDDDLLINSGLKNCIKFLDNNNQYSGCTAEGGYLVLNKKNNINKILPFKTNECEETDVISRIENMIVNYASPWFIYRTKFLTVSLEICSKFMNQRAVEIFLLFDTLCNGKIKKIKNSLYVIRGIHLTNYKYNENELNIEKEVYQAVSNKLKISVEKNIPKNLIDKVAGYLCIRPKHVPLNTNIINHYMAVVKVNIIIILKGEYFLVNKYHKKFYELMRD